MQGTLDERLGHALARWVRLVPRRARAIVWTTLALTVVLGAYAALGLQIHSDTVSLVGRDLPARRHHDAFSRLFPNLENALLVVLDAENPALARDSADRLLDALKGHPDVIVDAYLPGGGDFFEQNGLLYRSVEDLEIFAEQMAAVQPILAELERDPSLANMASLIRRGLDRAGAAPDDAERWSEVLERVGRATVRVYDEYPLAISWEELLLRGSAIEVGDRRVLVVHAHLDFGHILPARLPLRLIREEAEALGLVPERGVEVRLTGNPVLNHEEMLGLAWDIGGAGVFCFLLVAALLARAYRSWRLSAAALSTLLVGLIWTAAFAEATVGHLNVISLAFGILFIGLGVDFCIHLGMRYAEVLRSGSSHPDALAEAARSVGSSLVICAVTTAIGFLVFVPTSYIGVAELGLIAGGGMAIILLLTLSFFPALLSGWLALPPDDELRLPRLRLAALERHPRKVRWLAGGVFLLSLLGLPRAGFAPNVIDLRDPDTESVRTFNDLLERSGTASPWFLNAVAEDLPTADALAERLSALESVDSSLTLSSYIPGDQEEKIAILEDVAFMMDPTTALPPDPSSQPDDAEQIDALRGLRDFLEGAWVTRQSGVLAGSMRRLHGHLDRFLDRLQEEEDPTQALATLEDVLLSSLPGQLARMRRALAPEPIDREALPEPLVRRMIGEGGAARVQVFPAGVLRDEPELRAFTSEVLSVAPRASGIAINLLAFAEACRDAFRQALASALVAIGLFLLLLWRSLRDTALAVAPLLLAASCTVGVMAAIGLRFNFVNLIVIPLLFGIGIDSGIHLVHRAKQLRAAGEPLLESTTARAVLFSALTTTVSFGSLVLSSHRGMQSLGLLLVIGMVLTVVANLVVLPALLATPQGEGRSGGPVDPGEPA